MRRWPLVLLIVVIIVVGGRYIYGALNQTDDKTLIRQALTDAVTAAKEGRPGSVVELMSSNFKLNDEQTGLKRAVEFVKNNHPEVTIDDMEPVVSGDTAQINSHINIKVPIISQSMDFKNVQLLFKKESTMDWLIFPTTKWKLSAARVDPADLPELPSMGMP
jgi:hypothetical protein